MKNHLVATIILLTAPFFLASCVSTLLKEKAPTFSNEVNFKAPGLPFTKLNQSVYPSWKNKTTGNVLSIFSDCQSGNSISLSDLLRIIEDSVENSKKVSENNLIFQSKPALQRVIRGELDNNPIQIKSTAFIKMNCGYVVSLSGKPDQLQLDEKALETFTQSLNFK